MRLILASASPRRAELLRAAGYAFDIVVADVDESIRGAEAPALYVRRLAAEKSAAAQISVVSGFSRTVEIRTGPAKAGHYEGDEDAIVLGADTTVVVDGEILAKPRDDGDAAAMLRRIAGRAHEGLTGVSLRHGGVGVGRGGATRGDGAPPPPQGNTGDVAAGGGGGKKGGGGT